MRELISSLADEADILLLDSPPVLILADAAVLSTMVDGVLLVIDAGRTRRDAAAKAVESLRAVNARLVAPSLTGCPRAARAATITTTTTRTTDMARTAKGRAPAARPAGIGQGRTRTRREGEGSGMKVEG